jgi:hypothetical protein
MSAAAISLLLVHNAVSFDSAAQWTSPVTYTIDFITPCSPSHVYHTYGHACRASQVTGHHACSQRCDQRLRSQSHPSCAPPSTPLPAGSTVWHHKPDKHL